jgi:hypothetical protein
MNPYKSTTKIDKPVQCPKCYNAHNIVSEEKYRYGFMFLTKELHRIENICNSCGFAWISFPKQKIKQT